MSHSSPSHSPAAPAPPEATIRAHPIRKPPRRPHRRKIQAEGTDLSEARPERVRGRPAPVGEADLLVRGSSSRAAHT
eukprot:scaffold21325_cov70-Phaeocystis_antarctica.AAC.4